MAVSADHVIETFGTATEENQVSSLREAQVVKLPADAEVWVCGDLHDHTRNFNKFVAAADLANNPRRHVVLQELIHGDKIDAAGAEGSWEILHRAAELKCDYSKQVHFLLANHDLAQIHGEGIMKGGVGVCEAFNAGVKRDFKDRGNSVTVAITEFLLSLPLAVRAPNGLFMCHSLPTDEQIQNFDFSIFDRPLTGGDYKRRTGPVYQLVWGRKTSPAGVATFADKVGAKLLIVGHQPQESGYAVVGDRMLIVASDHNQGVFVTADTSSDYDMDRLVGRIQKFVGLDVGGEAA
ncbi:MAG TPA: metallophosphoesterase [Tepidisphaeraceae bacterium]|nr:metallophosphoesterase [Tepidisphaeraceae bacterium]